jgi:glycerophosphoryl diester phosphodiesterase
VYSSKLSPLAELLEKAVHTDTFKTTALADIAVIMKNDEPALKLLATKRTLVIGHRGYCAVAPENTLPSFKLAMDAGADLVELDYQHSQDGVPMVFHDSILDRTTNARKKWKRRRIKIARKTADELQTLDAGSWFDTKFAGAKIPLLTQAQDFICSQGGVPLIEHKSGDAETLAKLLRELNLINKVIVISFNWKFLRELHELEPTQVLGALGPPARLSHGRRPAHVRRGLAARLKDLARTGAKIAIWNPRISKRAIQLAHAHELKIWIYTINRSKAARGLVRRGVDGIITNNISAIQHASQSPDLF